jgi:hypothetical protein
MKDLRKCQLSSNGIIRFFLIKHQIFIFLARYFSPFISLKHHIKLVRLMTQLGMGLSTFCFVIVTQAGISPWDFTPDPSFPPTTSVTSTGSATVKYTVTNNTPMSHSLVVASAVGAHQKGPCLVGPKGSAKSTCILTLIIKGSALPARGSSGGPVLCSYRSWETPSMSLCSVPRLEDRLAIRLVPNSLSMLPIPIQEATANQFFVYNLKPTVKFYDENANAGYPAQGIVSPVEQDGLRFDPTSFSITGTPTRTGTYLFKVGAQNVYGTAAPVDFVMQVQVNAKDRPVFKQHYSMASALPDQKYSMNLMELVEPQTGFMLTNQISFRIDTDLSHPDWLHIASDDATRLEGKVPPEAAGQEVEVTLIASSNTGGDSLPLKVKIPIAYDPEKRPVINPFGLEKLADTDIYEDLSGYIDDPAHDANLKLTLDNVEPAAPWLGISSLNPTVLEGAVPDKDTGQQFKLTLRAHTSVGGASEPIVIPLQISIDPKQTPRFKVAKPLMPILYREQPFSYDFVAANDIYPEYNDFPYQIEFAKNFNPPSWLRLEGNKLISDMVPGDAYRKIIIKIVIKNIPGGVSEEYLLSLISMD